MPVIKALPSPEIIKGFRGVLDFYVWRGLNCVRTWPRIPYANRSPKSLASAAIFGLVIQSYALLGGTLKTLFIANSTDQDRTGRDLFISAVYGHLHETNMSDFLTLLTECTAYLQTLTDLVNALASVGTDELRTLPGYDGADHQPLLVDASKHAQVDVLSSALPSGAATDAKLDTQITALEKIDDLQAALESIQTDRLQIRGEDQLFSFKSVFHDRTVTYNATAGTNHLNSIIVPANELWVITMISGQNRTSVCSIISAAIHQGGTRHFLNSRIPTIPWESIGWSGQAYLTEGGYCTVEFRNCNVNDDLFTHFAGYKMTLET